MFKNLKQEKTNLRIQLIGGRTVRKNKAGEQFCEQGLSKVERSETGRWKWEVVSATAQQETQKA